MVAMAPWMTGGMEVDVAWVVLDMVLLPVALAENHSVPGGGRLMPSSFTRKKTCFQVQSLMRCYWLLFSMKLQYCDAYMLQRNWYMHIKYVVDVVLKLVLHKQVHVHEIHVDVFLKLLKASSQFLFLSALLTTSFEFMLNRAFCKI